MYHLHVWHSTLGSPTYPGGQKQRGVCCSTSHSAFKPQLQGLTQLSLKHALSMGHSLSASQPIDNAEID